LTSDACKARRIKMDNQKIKSSHEVRIEEIYQISKGIEHKELKVTGLIENRAQGKRVVDFYENITHLEQILALKSMLKCIKRN